MRDALVSVLVSVYNVAPWIDECLQSIVDQDYRNLEIILIDDASTDGTGERADAWAEIDSRIVVTHKETNAGLSDSRNMSLRMAQGEYLAFVDGDDRIMPSMISKMMQELEKSDADVALCGWVDLDSDARYDRSLEIETGAVGDAAHALSHCFPKVGDTRYSPYLWNKIFKKSTVLDQAGQPIPFNVERTSCEDVCWLIRVLSGIGKAVYISDALYCYRSARLGNRTTGTLTDPRLALSAVDAFEEGYRLLERQGFDCADNVLQRTILHRQRCMYAALAGKDEDAWRRCANHYLRDVAAWFAFNPSPERLVWCMKRLVRRFQLEVAHRKEGLA